MRRGLTFPDLVTTRFHRPRAWAFLAQWLVRAITLSLQARAWDDLAQALLEQVVRGLRAQRVAQPVPVHQDLEAHQDLGAHLVQLDLEHQGQVGLRGHREPEPEPELEHPVDRDQVVVVVAELPEPLVRVARRIEPASQSAPSAKSLSSVQHLASVERLFQEVTAARLFACAAARPFKISPTR